MIYFDFDALETRESVLFWFPVAVIPTEEPWELTNRSGKSSLLARKRCLCSYLTEVSNAGEGVPGRCCPWSKQAYAKQTSCSDLHWARAHFDWWRGDAWHTLYLNSFGDWIRKGFPTGKLLPSPSRLSSQLRHFLRHVSCFHKLNLFLLRVPTPTAFWYTNLEKLVWSLGRLDHDSVPVCRTKCPILAEWCVSTTQKGS